ncbi:nucleotidyltransferase domain-containing protein [Ignavibacteriales bacterium]
MIDATPEQPGLVKSILRHFVPTAKIIVFGSRVMGNTRDTSDLDLAIDDNRKLTLSELGLIIEAFQESDLSFRVDVIDWHRTSESFKEVINQGFEEIRL